MAKAQAKAQRIRVRCRFFEVLVMMLSDTRSRQFCF
jgi:hypothetical protein